MRIETKVTYEHGVSIIVTDTENKKYKQYIWIAHPDYTDEIIVKKPKKN